MNNILITGSSGMVGTRFFETVIKKGHVALGVDRRKNNWNKSLNKYTSIVNILKTKELANLPKDIELIFHLAANARVYDLVKTPSLSLENAVSTFNLLEFARRRNVKGLVFASSREVYGDVIQTGVISENMINVEKCKSPYSASKIYGESLIHAYHKAYGIDFVIMRLSNVYGMYDDSDRVIPLWIQQTLNNRDLMVYGEDKALDFNYINDTVNGMILIGEKFDSIKNTTFNIASGQRTNLLSVAQKIRSLLGGENSILIKKNRLGEVTSFQADISKATELLGYKPKVDLDEGLQKTVTWYQKYYRSTKQTIT